MLYHYTLSRITKSKKTDNVKKCKRSFIYWWWVCKLAKLLWKVALQCLKQLILCLSYDAEITLPDIFPREISAHVH